METSHRDVSTLTRLGRCRTYIRELFPNISSLTRLHHHHLFFFIAVSGWQLAFGNNPRGEEKSNGKEHKKKGKDKGKQGFDDG